MESIRKLLGELRNDDFRYGLLDSGDRLLLGISLNKASLLFLSILSSYSSFQKKVFKVTPVLIDTGLDKDRIKEVSDYVSKLGYKLEIVDKSLAFENQLYKKKGVFSYPIYSRFIKGALFEYAHEFGYNKIVLGNDLEDLRIAYHLSFKEDVNLPLLPIKEKDSKRRLTLIRPFLFVSKDIIEDASIKKDVPACAREVISKGERYKKAKEEIASSPIEDASFKKRIALFDTFLKDEELGDEEYLPYTLHKVVTPSDIATYLQFEKEAIIPHFSQNREYYLIYQNHSPIGQVSIERKTAHEVNIFSFYAPEKNEKIETLLAHYLSSLANPMIISSYLDFSFFKIKRPDESGLFITKIKR